MKKSNFFRINILIDVSAFLLILFVFALLIVNLINNNTSADWTIYIFYAPAFFLLRFIFMFFQIFRYKKIKIWKTILYCSALLIVAYILFIIQRLFAFWCMFGQ